GDDVPHDPFPTRRSSDLCPPYASLGDSSFRSVQTGSSRQVSANATFSRSVSGVSRFGACAAGQGRVYSEHYPGYAGCASVRPPRTDTRRPPPPPPLAGDVSFSALPVPSKSAKLLRGAACRSHG